MALPHADRFRLKSLILEELESDRWSTDRISLLLGEFGAEGWDGNWQGPTLIDVITPMSDRELADLAAVALGVDASEIKDVVEPVGGSDNWKPGYARLFLSHSAVHKAFVADVADELAVIGIHGFVAHDSLEISKPWQSQIEAALRSMQAFVAIVHPELNASAWCHQEIGWALGRRVPFHVLRLGADPQAFASRDQWPSVVGDPAKLVATTIGAWVAQLPEMGEALVDGLITALGDAGNYIDAGAAAERLAALGSLTDEQFERLNSVWWSNDQLYGGHLPAQPMQRLYEACKRSWPPPRTKQSADGPELDEPF